MPWEVEPSRVVCPAPLMPHQPAAAFADVQTSAQWVSPALVSLREGRIT